MKLLERKPSFKLLRNKKYKSLSLFEKMLHLGRKHLIVVLPVCISPVCHIELGGFDTFISPEAISMSLLFDFA